MTDVVVICPTRSRPREAAEMLRSLRDTAVMFSTQVALIVDEDDPALPDYLAIPDGFTAAGDPYPLRPSDKPAVVVLSDDETGNLVRATNSAARRMWHDDIVLGHVGDDHRFRTPGWDRRILDVLSSPGVAFADDGYWAERIATAPFVSAPIPRALGWLALPFCRHNGWDNAIMDIGREIGSLHYLPDVLIEHPDPEVRRTSRDPGYVKARSFQDADRTALGHWRDSQLRDDAAAVRVAIAQAAAA